WCRIQHPGPRVLFASGVHVVERGTDRVQRILVNAMQIQFRLKGRASQREQSSICGFFGPGDVGDTIICEHRSMGERDIETPSRLGFVAGDEQLVLVFVNRDRLTGTTVSILQQGGGSEGERNATIGGVGPMK
ncbi:hypothetical protein PoMZ_12653, partial [Pyricularia oryzae]